MLSPRLPGRGLILSMDRMFRLAENRTLPPAKRGRLIRMKTRHSNIVFCFALAFACTICLSGRDRPDKQRAAAKDSVHPGEICEESRGDGKSGSDHPIAIVAGESIYERDLAGATAGQLLQLRQQEYKLKTQALEELIRKKVVELEARKQGLSADQLYEKEVDAKVPDPSDAELEGYYLAVKSQVNQPFQEMKPAIQKIVKKLKTEQARQDYADSLRAKDQVVVLLSPPIVEVGFDAARVRGNPGAPVTIVEFSDFQCPYCKKAAATLKDLLAKYEGRVKLAYRDFPMRQLHSQAQMAAEASRCAEEQGKFWEFHDAMFADQTRLDQPGLTATAQKLGLDENSFQSCLASGKFKAQIEQDLQDGTKAGVSGTPGFFINGVFVSGSQPEGEFEKIIDRELAATGNKGPTQGSP